MSEIKLSGGEITVVKTLGVSGGTMRGEILQSRMGGMEDAELLDTLQGLMAVGYVVGSKDHVRSVQEMLKADFRVNSSYSRDLQESLAPRKVVKKSRRVRRE